MSNLLSRPAKIAALEVVKMRLTIFRERLPTVVIIRLPQTWTPARITEVVGNEIQGASSSRAAVREIRPLFKRGPRLATTTQWVVVNLVTFNALVARRRIGAGLVNSHCSDYVDQPWCFKCQKYGYIAKNC